MVGEASPAGRVPVGVVGLEGSVVMAVELSSPPEKPVPWTVYVKLHPYKSIVVESRTWYNARELGEAEFRRQGDRYAREELEAVIQNVGSFMEGPTK